MIEAQGPVAEMEALAAQLGRVRAEVGKRILGQGAVVDLALIALISGGHGLMVGVPGLGKTLLVETLGHVLGLKAGRVQFTPDLMPADILGAEVLETADDGRRAFRFLPGPVFCEILLADEVNRASPRTQSALLQAMQERQVTVAGVDHALGPPFHVLATQNPIEQEGTYPLPEAQLDRFMLQIDLGFPARDAEREILFATTGVTVPEVATVMSREGLIAAQAMVRRMPVGERVVEAILDLVRACRPGTEEGRAMDGALLWGPGPRAAQALMLAVRARALLQGRLAPGLADVAALALPVLSHRLALGYAARAEGQTAAGLIAGVAARVIGPEAAA